MLLISNSTLKAAVTAAPEDGKANDAVIALLSDEWRVPKSSLSVLKGAASRAKTVALAGDPAALAERIREWARANG